MVATFEAVTTWHIETSVGDAGSFHHRDLSNVDRPTVWLHTVRRPALVLGSSQSPDLVDRDAAARAGIEVCGRRSGGGLVLVEPGSSCWIDVLIPPRDPRWSEDVNRAFLWVGDVWRDALASLRIPHLDVHRERIQHAAAGRFLCFAGLGPGEVVQRDGERTSKVVGLSQRRQRNVARFQGLLVTRTDLDLTRRLVRTDAWPRDLEPLPLDIGLAGPLDLSTVPDRFLEQLRATDR